MHGADEVIPRLARGQLANPLFLAGQVIHFQPETDDERGVFALRAADFFHVLIKLIGAHPPVVEIITTHRRVIGETDLGESERDGLRGIIRRLADRMAAKRRVHVIISRQRHGRSLEASGAGEKAETLKAETPKTRRERVRQKKFLNVSSSRGPARAERRRPTALVVC